MRNYILAVTGASGTIYSLRLLECLLQQEAVIHLVISKPAQIVARQEIGSSWAEILETSYSSQLGKGLIRIWDNEDFTASIASGSFPSQGMIIAPTSMSTLAAVTHGLSSNLIQRAADIMLKEKKPLVLVPRETPLSVIHLRNMLKLCQAGAQIVPPIPAFYNHPQTIKDIVDFGVGRVLDVLGLEHQLYQRWGDNTNKLVSRGGIVSVQKI